jgi:hypothetical protein
MGYRSDVKIVVIASSKEAMDDLLAVYAMLPKVQKAGGFDELGWERYELGEGRVLTYEENDVGWHLGDNDVHLGDNNVHFDVNAIMELCELVDTFNQERSEDVYAARFVRIGEQYEDIEVYDYGDSYEYEMWDALPVHRVAEFNL